MDYRILKPKDLKEPKVYFTGCDSVVQSLFEITESELTDKLKILSLLNEKVTIATSHILDSHFAYKMLTKEKLLLQEGVLVPALRSQFREFKEYVSKRRTRLRKFVLNSDYLSPRLIRKADSMLNAKVEFLAENTKEVVSWELGPTSEDFKMRLVNDLTSKILY